jgi:3-hydroxyacyl-[acyl-carrier-protein] dehydratase
MRFLLIDRIVQLEHGVRITAVKNVSLAEEYLRDHFPRFPVIPGVMMLEAMTQAGAWLVRATDDFAQSVVVLKEARNIKYADFVAPGEVLSVTAEIQEHGPRETRLTASGSVGGAATVSGRLVLEHYNLADTNPEQARTDEHMKREMRKLFGVILGQQAGHFNPVLMSKSL